MRVNQKLAREILREECQEARLYEQRDNEWFKITADLANACDSFGLIMIAMLGTALLAKATHAEVDVFSLKARDDSKGAYSARGLATNVLARESAALGINLGTDGREPLNNQPFFAPNRITKDLPVHVNSQEAFRHLYAALEKLAPLTAELPRRRALRGYLAARFTKPRVERASLTGIDELTIEQFIPVVRTFVGNDSEGGKRAQAVAAGALSVLTSMDRVKVKRVNDPSRSIPGDVTVYSGITDNAVDRVFEVRDKPVTLDECLGLLNKLSGTVIESSAVLAVARDQIHFDDASVQRRASKLGLKFRIFFGWESFMRETLFWSEIGTGLLGKSHKAIATYLEKLQVSEQGHDLWYSLFADGTL